MERCRLVFSGSGGQGVITAAILVTTGALYFKRIERTFADVI